LKNDPFLETDLIDADGDISDLGFVTATRVILSAEQLRPEQLRPEQQPQVLSMQFASRGLKSHL
jgi:hypothetical protein